MEITVATDAGSFITALARMQTAAEQPMQNESIREGVTEAAYVYLGAMRGQFKSASGGNGAWQDLSASTKYERLRQAMGGFKKTPGITKAVRLAQASSIPFPILYVTGSLYTSLYPGEPGFFEQTLTNGIAVGTNDPVARFHQSGTPKMPARSILTAPSAETMKKMGGRVGAGFRAAWLSALTGM